MKNFIYVISLLTILVLTGVSQAEIVYIHNDALGSPMMETNELGAVISRTHYKPFGGALEGTKDGVGYTGHLNDADLGLTYMQARYYDPVIGRFYSNDPLAFRDVYSFNRYSYANNNPYKYVDPTGMSSVKGACGGAVPSGVCFSGNDNKDTSIQDDMGDDSDFLNAEWGKVTTDGSGNITHASIICGISCNAEAGLYSYQHSMDLIRIRNQNDYGGLAAEALYKIAEYSSYGFLAGEALVASSTKWAFMKASDKVAYFMIVGDGSTLGIAGAGAVISDTIYLGLYQNARTLIPRMALKSTKGKPVIRNGKFVID